MREGLGYRDLPFFKPSMFPTSFGDVLELLEDVLELLEDVLFFLILQGWQQQVDSR